MKACGHLDPDAGEMQKLCISLVPIFNHLSLDEMKEIVKTTRSATYGKNEEIYGPGDPAGNLYIVHRGRVKIFRLSESGKEQLIRILEPGDFIGELSIFTETAEDHYAIALEKTELCLMRRQELHDFLLRYPAISIKILEEFSRRLEKTEKLVSSITSEDAEKRIASYLSELAEEAKEAKIQLPMSKKDLASHLGTTPETVSRKLAEFQSNGWIELAGQRNIRILDKKALAAL